MKNFGRYLLVGILLVLVFSVFAAAEQQTAADITDSTVFSGSGFDDFSFLYDGKISSFRSSQGEASITLQNEAGIGALYLIFDLEPGTYTVTADGESFSAGSDGFLHEYLDLTLHFGSAPKSVTLDFTSVRLSEISVFSPGTPPDSVQLWERPAQGKTDILLFSTHGDDDQLFFAGLLPLYAGERGYAVQVVYLTDHRNLTNARVHEMLNGLWAVGVRAYPVFGSAADFRIDDMEKTYKRYESMGVSRTDLLHFVVEQLRRFRPQVAIGHDLQGEYGHGMHMVYADLLTKAVAVSADESVFPDLAEKYGVWDVPKTYLHLYPENPILLNYDQPLAAFDGLTAFQVTQKKGYPCHASQQYTWFTKWLNGHDGEITKASQIQTYSPCAFGLYRSTVGADTDRNDFFEHLTSYAQRQRLILEQATLAFQSALKKCVAGPLQRLFAGA